MDRAGGAAGPHSNPASAMSRTTEVSLCRVCRRRPEAFLGTRCCFSCWPGGPVTPPPCLKCGSDQDYWAGGKCARCHLYGVVSTAQTCPDCLAHGTIKKLKWLCHACVGWRAGHPTVAACRTCGNTLHVAEDGSCRLCHHQARLLAPLLGRFDLIEANRHGQQLFLADLKHRKGSRSQRQREVTSTLDELDPPGADQPLLLDVWTDTPLFQPQRDYADLRQKDMPWPADTVLLHRVWAMVDARAERLGWCGAVKQRTRGGVRIILGLHEDRDAPIRYSSLDVLSEFGLTVKHVADVLDEAGLLLNDKENTQKVWFERKILGLPETMTNELRVWFDIMTQGRPRPPRRRPRKDTTVRLHLTWALPVLNEWAARGCDSLREIARQDVTAALTASDHPSRTGQGLRSIFSILKQDHVVFVDPTARMLLGYHAPREPLPVEASAIKALLDPSDPARAAVAALAAFHALATGQIRSLQLVDVRAGRLLIDDRCIPLADPVRQRIAAYLDYRNTRWPTTANPHLFVNQRSVFGLEQVSHRWIKLLLGPGVSCRSIREDRILAEAMASRGDSRRLHDMFGLSVNATQRYTNVVDHPSLEKASG